MLTEEQLEYKNSETKDHDSKMQKEYIKPKIERLREDFKVVVDVFEFFTSKDDDEGSAKRKLDKVTDKLMYIKSMLKKSTEPLDFRYTSYGNRLSEYEISFDSLINSLCDQMNDLKNEVIECIEDGLKSAMAIAKENHELKVFLKKEKEEAMHQQQSHNFAVTEKNTILATCRKLEEQIERKNQQIQQLQKEGTVTLWKREKTKLVEEIKSNEKSLGKQVEKLELEALETKERLQRRIMELTDQVKFLKMEKELGGKVDLNFNENRGSNTPTNDHKALKQQLYRKERALVMAEAELQKQQKYFIGFIHGLKSDFKIMLERQGITPEKFSRDQKAYMNMLNRLYTAAKEGVLSDLKAKVPPHYQGVIQETLRHPLGKRLTRSMSQLEKEYIELQKSGSIYDSSLVKPTFSMWRDAKSVVGSNEAQTYGLHPELIDKATGKPLVHEAAKYFPEWTQSEIKEMFGQFKNFDQNKDFTLDTEELLEAIPDILGKMTTTEEIEEAMTEVDKDNSGTVDFYEFLTVARLITQQKGKSSIFKKKRLMALQKSSQVNSKVCVLQ